MNRYEATRRRHPLAPAGRVIDGIRKERQMMAQLRGEADLVIDTSGLSPHALRDRIRAALAEQPADAGLQVSVQSFGFKFGPPRDADIQLDVRFLPNPHWVPELRPLPGTDRRIGDYVRGQDDYATALEATEAMLDAALGGFRREGKAYLTVAVGCTGGHHRSVVVAEDLAAYFRARGLPVTLSHRDLERG